MGKKLTKKQREHILAIKSDAGYAYRKINKLETEIVRTKNIRRRRVEELAKAWMAYIDYLGLNKYRPHQFIPKIKTKGALCYAGDALFTHGERSVISRYLKENGLVSMDKWKYYNVRWRDETWRKEKNKKD